MPRTFPVGASTATDGLTCVTASHLARNFGRWQDIALREPVYVVHRGRPRLALTSVEFLGRLIDGHGDSGDWVARRRILIDAIDDPVAIIDRRDRLSATNAAMRGYLGLRGADADDAPIAALTSKPIAGGIVDLARRARITGMIERVELAVDSMGTGFVEAVAQPADDDVFILIRDLSARHARDRAVSLLGAFDNIFEKLDGAALARINLRGYLADPSPSLARLAGINPDVVTLARFATLFDVGSRAGMGDMLERVLRGESPGATGALLLARGAERMPVTVAMSPVASRIAVEGALAIITRSVE